MITNLQSIQEMGILANRNARSQSLQFRRYNLIYGFNGSGKSTLSRLFSSLEAGNLHARLPEGCSFEVSLDNQTSLGCPSSPHGLQRRLKVFNTDFVEANLQWSTGQANPVFFIGASQADAAAELSRIEGKLEKSMAAKTLAEAAQKAADKNFATFRRERAKLTASRLHLGNRKYEAPALAKDFETWKTEGATLLTSNELEAAEDTRRLEQAMPRLNPLVFDVPAIETAYRFITEICGQSLTTVALQEIQRFPDMLVWLKKGHEFHTQHDLTSCLFCGNIVDEKRRTLLASALDDHVDRFISRLEKTAERLDSVSAELAGLIDAVPPPEVLLTEIRPNYEDAQRSVLQELRQFQAYLGILQNLLSKKRAHPATPIDTSTLTPPSEVADAARRLSDAIESTNGHLKTHNDAVENFATHKHNAEIAIRRHFIADCRDEYAKYAKDLQSAQDSLIASSNEVDRLNASATQLRQKIREHGPAAAAINKLVASYLGHGELTIHPMDQGYQILRYGQPIQGTPSEGEKTAIAIAYFLSSIEADGRKLKDMIVVVDDPVSSLDTRALNFACSLVLNRLNDAAQVFVLTHNLQCMNEFRKVWKTRARPLEEGKKPTATFLFIDVVIPEGAGKRTSNIQEMPRLLREYDSEYHFLFSHFLKFTTDPNAYYDHGYMMPNVLRRVLDVFLAFKCPGSSGFVGQLRKLCTDYPELNQDRLAALERLVQVESHSDNLDDLLSFSSMTIEETREAAIALLETMEKVDPKHLASLRFLCR